MKRFLKILIFIFNIKIKFQKPKNKKIIIYDYVGSENFKYVVKKKNYFLLRVRPNQIKNIYFFPKIFFLMLKFYRGNIVTAYFTSLIVSINPKVVITYIDNSFKFCEIAKLLKNKIKFVAVQNAFRLDVLEHEYLFKRGYHRKNLNNKLFIPHFFCFGDFEQKLYKKLKIKVENIYKLGSLRAANAIQYLKNKNFDFKKKIFDICLISDTTWFGHFLKKKNNRIPESKNLEIGTIKLIKFTIDFCKKNKKKLIFITKNKDLRSPQFLKEFSFYKKNLSNEDYQYLYSSIQKKYLRKNYQYATSYNSKVTVGIISTLLGENLSFGNKILSCNLTNIKIFNFPISGICSINDCNYLKFENRLKKILYMSNKKYFFRVGKNRNKLCFNERHHNPIDYLKKYLDNFIKTI